MRRQARLMFPIIFILLAFLFRRARSLLAWKSR
jgi:hypothetical protein